MSKILKEVRAIMSEASTQIGGLLASQFTTRRDEFANLYIDYANGDVLKLPIIPFRSYQIEVAQALFLEGIKRFALERPRRSGKEVESWNMIIQGAVESPGMYMMVYPTNVRANAVLWNGAIVLPDGSSLKFLDMIPERLVQRIDNQNHMIHLVNGSVIWVLGSDIDPNKLRGTNPRGIAFCEFAFQDPHVFYIMLPVLRQNGGWLITQSTYDGMNHFYQLIKRNWEDPNWYCREDSIVTLVDENGNRYITDEMIEEDRQAGMPEYLIQQEYYGVVQINQETKYFAHQVKAIYDDERLIERLVIPNQNVYAAWDLGMNDKNAIVLFQIKPIQNHIRPQVIAYMENNNHNLNYYLNEIRAFCARAGLPFKSHFIPHDGQKRDFNTGKNTIDFMREAGEQAYIVPRPGSKLNAIEAMRRMLYYTDFEKNGTQRLIDCLANYSKEYDDKIDEYKNKPVHNWASHGVDAFQTMTLAIDANMINYQAYDVLYYND